MKSIYLMTLLGLVSAGCSPAGKSPDFEAMTAARTDSILVRTGLLGANLR